METSDETPPAEFFSPLNDTKYADLQGRLTSNREESWDYIVLKLLHEAALKLSAGCFEFEAHTVKSVKTDEYLVEVIRAFDFPNVEIEMWWKEDVVESVSLRHVDYELPEIRIPPPTYMMKVETYSDEDE